jgi:hypothetical protein
LVVYSLDADTTYVGNTSNYQKCGNDISDYLKIKFDNLDRLDEHTFKVRFLKDSGTNVGDDKGYFMILK